MRPKVSIHSLSRPLKHAFVLLMIGSYASIAHGQATHIYWGEQSTTDAIKRVEIGQSTPQTVITSGVTGPRQVFFDSTNSKVYWTDISNDNIRSADPDGSNPQTVLSISNPRGIAVDASGGKLYTSSRNLQQVLRTNLDGSGAEVLSTMTGSQTPAGIALDIAGGKVYWGVRTSPEIRRSNLDGTSEEVLFNSASGVDGSSFNDLSGPGGIALDLTNERVYWATRDSNTIQYGNMDGSGSVTTLKSGLSYPVAVAIDQTSQKLYWTERDANTILRSDLDGTNTETLLTGLNSPRYLGLATIPEPSTYGLILGGLALGAVLAWRRRQADRS